MTGKAIFVGYRRDDTADVAGRVYDALGRRFGKASIFKDVDSLRPGVDFGESIKSVLPRCRVALILIGPKWADARDGRGQKRLEDPNDWVRIEIETALATPGLDVVPVLVNGARMPLPEELPESLHSLLRRHAALIRRDPDFHDDMNRLVKSLQQSLKTGVIDLSMISGGSIVSDSQNGHAPQRTRMAWALPAVFAAVAVGAVLLNWDRFFHGQSIDDASPANLVQIASGETFRDCAHCPEMVVIPAGSFSMGSPADEAGHHPMEGPQRRINIERFAVGKFEVTFNDWETCVDRGGCRSIPDDQGWGRSSRPLINISWHAAQNYVDWLSRETGRSYRLLTEAEWEYAARAGTVTPWSWGDDPGVACIYANLLDQSDDASGACSDGVGEQTAPVGRYRANAFGLFDMHGNVSELTQDCYEQGLDSIPDNGSANTAGSCVFRVMRGGAWNSMSIEARSAARVPVDGYERGDTLGFRVARTL